MSIKITGIKEIDKKLKQLGPKISKKIIRKSMRPAMKPIMQDARSKCPVRTGTLRRSIKVRALKRSRKKFGVMVSTSGADTMFRGEAYYGGMIEFGMTNRMIPAQPFMRPAYEAGKKRARSVQQKLLLQLLEQALKS